MDLRGVRFGNSGCPMGRSRLAVIGAVWGVLGGLKREKNNKGLANKKKQQTGGLHKPRRETKKSQLQKTLQRALF